MLKERSIKTLPLDGGVQPFHLVNTVQAWRGTNLHEYLNNYADVLAWCEKVGLLKKEEIRGLKAAAEVQPAAAEKAFQKIIQTRALLYHFFSALAATDKATLPSFLPVFNKQVHEALEHFAWTSTKSGLRYIHDNETALLLPLWMVLKAAHDVLFTEDHARIKECPRCGWLFLDTTKNGKRRWCHPQGCGSIEKSKRYYRKKVQASHP
jgi:predicted RNA-binding Zn ribbon-like protein